MHSSDRVRETALRADLLAGGVIVAALILFVTLGGRVIPNALRSLFLGGPEVPPSLSAALLLNVALVLFAWRRCKELRQQALARVVAEKEAQAAVMTDYTTRLPNRAALSHAAERLLASHTQLALLVLDLDHFKKVNDHYGHGGGDEVLRWVGDRVKATAPIGACSGRLGGDEFAVLVSGLDAQSRAVTLLAERLVSALSEPVRISGGVTQIGVSIGISYPRDGDVHFSDFLRRSDIAMYEAKKAGRNRIAWFNSEMEDLVRRQSQLEADMRDGIPAGDFVPFYQPQYKIGSGELHGFEVLARWNHPDEGLMEPLQFISLAEGTGLIGPLSLSVMRQALRQAREWQPDLMIAVNVSPVQLKDRLFAQRVMKVLTETGFPAQRLELEITESAIFEDCDQALETINSLKAIGVTVSLDDFGTGYSSLAQLQNLPFDRIKIDKSFVLSMLHNDESAAIVRAIATLGESLKLPITAEGIETESILAHLVSIGCSEGQGWLYGKPLPADKVAQTFPEVVGAEGLTASLPARAQEAVSFIPERRDGRRRGSAKAA
ncbi:MAG TPA: EAL domain-containing protein [Allosphingosinicella sp.]|jgi:diguanylate cyclase (GGDEF)-like protein